MSTESRRPFAVLAVTTLGLMFVIINGSSVNVALPAMSGYFNVGSSTADWFLVAFMLSNTAFILVFGRISDMAGRKRIYLIGLGFFVVFSALTPLAPNAVVVIILRALQGVAAATTVTNTSALIADAFPPSRLAQGLGLNLTAAAVANTIGPTVGGLLITAFGWQSIFLVNVPFGIAAIVLGAKVLDGRREVAKVRERFDFAGAVLSAAGLACLLYGVNQISVGGIGDPRVIAFIGGGLVLLVAFVVVESRVEHPLVDLSLVRNYARACAYGAAFFNSFARAGTVVLVALHLQIVGNHSPAESGVVIMVMAIAMMVGSPLAGRLSRVYSARLLSGIGGLSLFGGLVALMLVLDSDSLPAVILSLVAIGFGIGFFTTPNTTSIMSGVASGRRAVANGVRSMLYNSAQALGTTVSLLLLAAAGVQSYAVPDSAPNVRQGFTFGIMLLAISALVALILALARGGGWRAVGVLSGDVSPETAAVSTAESVELALGENVAEADAEALDEALQAPGRARE